MPDVAENSRKIRTERDPWRLAIQQSLEASVRVSDKGWGQRPGGSEPRSRDSKGKSSVKLGCMGRKRGPSREGRRKGLFLFLRRENLEQSNLGSSSK